MNNLNNSSKNNQPSNQPSNKYYKNCNSTFKNNLFDEGNRLETVVYLFMHGSISYINTEFFKLPENIQVIYANDIDKLGPAIPDINYQIIHQSYNRNGYLLDNYGCPSKTLKYIQNNFDEWISDNANYYSESINDIKESINSYHLNPQLTNINYNFLSEDTEMPSIIFFNVDRNEDNGYYIKTKMDIIPLFKDINNTFLRYSFNDIIDYIKNYLEIINVKYNILTIINHSCRKCDLFLEKCSDEEATNVFNSIKATTNISKKMLNIFLSEKQTQNQNELKNLKKSRNKLYKSYKKKLNLIEMPNINNICANRPLNIQRKHSINISNTLTKKRQNNSQNLVKNELKNNNNSVNKYSSFTSIKRHLDISREKRKIVSNGQSNEPQKKI